MRDPLRLACLACAVVLLAWPAPPAWIVLVIVAVCQANGVLILLRALARRSIAIDSARLAACTFLAGFLLMRLFGSALPALLMGLLTLVVTLVPDTPLRRLDPVKLSCLTSLATLSLLTDAAADAMLASLVVIQFNAFALFFDKYAAFVRWRRGRFVPIPRKLARSVILCAVPWGVLVLRVLAGPAASIAAAAVVAFALYFSRIVSFSRTTLKLSMSRSKTTIA